MGAPSNAPPPGYSPPPATGYTGVQAWNPGPGVAPAPRPMNWDMISFLTRFLGFALIFLGALLVVILGTPGGSLYSNPPPSSSDITSYLQSHANGVIAGRLLLALGAFLLGLGAGIKLHWVLRAPAGGSSEQWAWVLLERLFNYVVLGGSIVLLVWVVSWYPIFANATGVP